MIRVPEVRVIDSEGEQLGVMSTDAALARADEEGLDLVEVSPTARPPVCRIMDFGKYKYEQSKKQKESKKKQHSIQVKEVKFRPKTEEHDYQFKKRHAEEFLEKGHKVKITMMFRGRELDHRDLGMTMLARLEQDLVEVGNVERAAKFEGRLIVMYMAPIPGRPKQQTETQKSPETEPKISEQETADEEGKDAEAQDQQSSM
jgi:translation initiation factor IF-3